MLSPLLVPMHRGMNALDYLIEMSLMRPRYLIRLLTLSKGVAINRDHKSIESDDLDHAIKIFSDDLLNDLSNEIRDIYPLADDILLGFLAEKNLINTTKFWRKFLLLAQRQDPLATYSAY